MSLQQIVATKGDKIVNDALRHGGYVAEMLNKDYHKQNGAGFAREAMQTMDSMGGIKLQASEDHKINVLSKINQISQRDVFDIRQGLDLASHPSKSNKMMLADPQGSSIGNYTMQVALMYIIEFGSNLDQVKFGLRQYFPDTPAGALETFVDRGAAVYGRLNGADYNMPLPIRRPMNSYNYKYEAVRYSETVQIFPRDMLFTREKGSNNLENGPAGLQQRLAYETLYGMVRLETGKNLDLADAILRNGYSYPVGGTNVISTGAPTANQFVFPAPVGTYTAATGIMTPNDNLDIMRVLGAMLSGYTQMVAVNRYIREILIHPLVYTAIVQNVYFQAWLKESFITTRDIGPIQEILRYFTLPAFENIRFVCDDTSWNPNVTNQLVNQFAQNEYVMGGNATTITNSSFNGFVAVDASSQGGTLGGVLIAPDVLSGGYMSGASGYGVEVFDKTPITPENPYIAVIPFATYVVAPWMREAIFTIDFQVDVV